MDPSAISTPTTISPTTTLTQDNTTANTGAPPPQRPSLQHRQSSQSSHVSVSSSEHSSQHHHHRPVQHKAHRHHGHRLGANRNASFGHNLNKLTQLHANKMPNMHAHDGAGVGSSRMQRTTSQPNTPTQVNFAVGSGGRPGAHGRSRSGDFTESPGATGSGAASPRPQVKRNASAFVVPRNHSHSALKKNYSSGHLPRNLSGKALHKAAHAQQHTRAQPKRKHSGRSDRSVPASPVSPPPATQQPTVRFALEDEDDGGHDEDEEENEWTEESASVSPNVTRDHSRHNSVVLDPSAMAVKEQERLQAEHPHDRDVTSGEESSHTVIHDSERHDEEEETDRKEQVAKINGSSSYSAANAKPSAMLDADAITSRLLRRNAPSEHGTSTTEPQVTSVSAVVQPNSGNNHTLSYSQIQPSSQGSTLAASSGTPGRDLVSRFVNAGDSAEGTPRDGNLLPARKASPPKDEENGKLDISKRNKSAPNMADRGPISPAHARSGSRRSGTSTPGDLPPSRTQQKLLLQRASSALEPAKHIPAVLPRPGAAQLLGHGLSFGSTEGGMSAQVQALFAQINKEYNVVRRYQNPVANATARAREMPRPKGRTSSSASKVKARGRGENGIDGHDSPEENFRSSASVSHNQQRHSRHENSQEPIRDRKQQVKNEAQRGHKSRVSFDLPSVRTEESDDESATIANTPSRPGSLRRERDEAYEICRRLWDMDGEGIEAAG